MSGISDSPSRDRSASAISGLLVLLMVGMLVIAAPIISSYTRWFRAGHSPAAAATTVAAAIALLSLLFFGFWKSTRLTLAAGLLIGLLLAVVSGNTTALLIALALLVITLIAGDLVTRVLRGREAGRGELAISVAAGAAALGGILLLLGDAGLARPLPLIALAGLLLLARWRRIPELGGLLRDAARTALNRRNPATESLWLAIVGVTVVGGFLGALRPDVSFDGLAYHLPEIRDFAQSGHVEPLARVYETLLWRNHETYLGLAYMAGGEQAVQLLHFLVGLHLFGVIVALGRQFSKRSSSALCLLALAGFPLACVQLKEIYVDLPAALFLTASAVEIAASREEPRRLWLAGFLFGGAVATKIFAVLGGVGLLILAVRRQRGSLGRLVGFFLFAALPLLPWFAWSQTRQGFFLSPYSHPWLKSWSQPIGEAYIPERRQGELRHAGLSGFLRLPYDQTFRSPRFVAAGGSFTGLLPLLLLVGALGWGWRRFGLFCVAALAALVPWYLLASARTITPTIRFLIPLYPLYAVFTVVGLLNLTDSFRGRLGAAAAGSMAAISIALPAQLFSTPFDAKVALGLISREDALSAYLPVHPLWKKVKPEDRVLLLGDSDRYHCPANFILSESAFSRIGSDRSRWRDELRRLRINLIASVDQRYDRDLIDSLGDCVAVVDRHRMAILYRVSWERDCSHPPPNVPQ